MTFKGGWTPLGLIQPSIHVLSEQQSRKTDLLPRFLVENQWSFSSRACSINSLFPRGEMFGNFVNKNARAALKEYGDVNGVGVEYEMLDPTGPPHNPQYTARVMIGDSRYDTATAATKKDAKEYAADLALRALTQGKNFLQKLPFEPNGFVVLAVVDNTLGFDEYLMGLFGSLNAHKSCISNK